MANGATKDLSEMTTAELLAFMQDAARRVRENAEACSRAAAEAIAHADRAIELAADPVPAVAAPEPAAEVVGIGDGRDVVTAAPQASVAREIQLAAAAALGAGVSPRRAAIHAKLAVLDRLLAQMRPCA